MVDADDAAADGPVACNTYGCATDQAPLRVGDGGIQCTRVGADPTPAPAEWPDITGAPTPVVFVRAGATGGDGSMANPLGDLATAVAAHSEAHTFALARGSYALAGPLTLAASVTLIGSGPSSATTLVPADDMVGVDIAGHTTSVRLAHLAIAYAHAANAGAGILVEGQATATLDQVEVDDAWEGVRSVGSTVHGTGITVRRAGRRGVALLHDDAAALGSNADLDSALVRDGLGVGVLADRAVVTIAHALVTHNAADGVAILGGDPTQPSTVRDSAMLCNTITGIRVQNDGATVRGSLWTVASTQTPSAAPGGDGVFVGQGGTLTLDPAPTGAWPESMMGTQSLIEGNARTGVLISGPSHADVYGVTVASNRGAGVFVQHQAMVGTLGYALVNDNTGLGIALTSGASIVSLVCNLARGTRMSVIDTDMGSAVVGDGLSIADAASGTMAQVIDNHFENNQRFGAVFAGSAALLHSNTGSGNGFGLGSYGATLTDDGTNAIMGASPPPPTASLERAALGGP